MREGGRRDGVLLEEKCLQSGTPRAPKTEHEEYFFFQIFIYLFSKTSFVFFFIEL